MVRRISYCHSDVIARAQNDEMSAPTLEYLPSPDLFRVRPGRPRRFSGQAALGARGVLGALNPKPALSGEARSGQVRSGYYPAEIYYKTMRATVTI
jgi:hypothetical protein